MTSIRKDIIAYSGIILVLVLAKLTIVLGDVHHPQATGSLLQWPQLLVLSALGLIAVLLAPRAGFASLLESRISSRQRFLYPLLFGLGFAVFEIIISIFLKYPNFHVPFPFSIPVYFAGGTLYEIKYHLLPIVAIVWLVSTVLLKKKWPETVFWIAAVLLCLREPYAQVKMMQKMGMIAGTFWTVESFVQIYAANIFPLYLFRRYGFLAMLTFRLTTYLMWHLVWPPVHFGM